MVYKELIKKRINEKKFIVYDRKTDNWKRILDSTNKLVNYILVTRTRVEQ